MPFITAEPIEADGCRTDDECPPLLSCIGRQCINQCVANNPCTGNLECVIQNRPNPVVACVCPEGMVAGSYGDCKPGEKIISGMPYGMLTFY